MRIISGKFKGKQIKFLKSSFTRPLRDSVKENIFNILSHSKEIDIKIEDATVLDLYSGIGSFGLECISRGSEKVIFVENNEVTLNVLKLNIKNLSAFNQATIIDKKIEKISEIKDINQKFDIFFLDPPFKDKSFIEILKYINLKKNYKKNHLVIIHREKKSKDDFQDMLKIIATRQYGRSKIIFSKFNQ